MLLRRKLIKSEKGARNDWGSLGPWFDMMNHSASNYNVGYQFKPGSGLEITALRDISPEEELLITYGNNSDDDMFMFYGLVIAEIINKIFSMSVYNGPILNKIPDFAMKLGRIVFHVFCFP